MKGKGADTETMSWADPAPGHVHQDQSHLSSPGDAALQVAAGTMGASLDAGASLYLLLMFSWDLRSSQDFHCGIRCGEKKKRQKHYQWDLDQAGHLQSPPILHCCGSEHQSQSQLPKSQNNSVTAKVANPVPGAVG